MLDVRIYTIKIHFKEFGANFHPSQTSFLLSLGSIREVHFDLRSQGDILVAEDPAPTARGRLSPSIPSHLLPG